MRGITLFCLLVFLSWNVYAQRPYTYTITADSVLLTSCDSSELIIQNHTQNVPGFLFNTGNGRTIFKRGLQTLGNGSFVIGADTLKSWIQGGNSFGATGVLGTLDNNPLDLYSNGSQRLRLTPAGHALFGSTYDNGYNNFQFYGSIFDSLGYFSNFTSPFIGANNSGALRLRWGTGDGSYISFFYQGNPNLRGFLASPADSRPFVLYDQIGLSLESTPYMTVGAEGNLNSKFNIIHPMGSVGSLSIARIDTTSDTYVYDLNVNSAGHTLLGGNWSDNGNLLQVNGTSWFGGGMNVTGTVNAPTGGNPAIGLYVTPTLVASSTSSSLNGLIISPTFNANGYGGVTTYGLNVLNGDSKFANNIYLNSYGDTSRIFSPSTIMYQSNADTGIQHIFADYIGTPRAFSGTIVQIEGTSATSSASMLKVLGTNDSPVMDAMANGNIGIGTVSPTAQFHTTGSVRFAGLTQDSTQTKVLVSDANGNLYYRSASSLAGDNPVRSSLAVNGVIKSKKIIISPDEWADYVFDSTYRLPKLAEVESYIHQEHHLPGIPSAAVVLKDSLDMGQSQAALLKKIEELTLYSIEQNKKLVEQEQEIRQIKTQMEKMEKLLQKNEQ